MGISAQISEIGVHVHSIDYILKCNIVSSSGNRLQLSPLEKKVDMFQPDDPVVLMYMANGNLELLSGSTVSVSAASNVVDILVTENDIEQDRRIFERYPVSIAVSARRKFSSKRLHLIAKNISEYGMCAVSRVELDVNEAIDIDLITGKYMFYFVGKVVWSKKLGNSFEYGFQLTEFDVATKSNMAVYLGKLKEEYRSLYSKAR